MILTSPLENFRRLKPVPRLTVGMVICLGLQGCVPYPKLEEHWIDVDNPEFQRDFDLCKEQVLGNEGEYDTIEDCMLDKGWSKERDLEWDMLILETV